MKIKNLWYLAAIWPLAFLPFLSDPTPSGRRGAEAQSDTTYLSTGYSAYLVPIYADTVVQYPDTFILGGPDQDSIPSGALGRWYEGPGDSVIFLSYYIDDIPATEKDSTFIDSVWADWGLGIPYAYNAAVPQAPEVLVYTNEPSGLTGLLHATFQTHPDDSFPAMTNVQWDFGRVSDYNPIDGNYSSIASSPFGSNDSSGFAYYYPRAWMTSDTTWDLDLDYGQKDGTAPINYMVHSVDSWNELEHDEIFWAHWFLASPNHYIPPTAVNKIGFVEIGRPENNWGSSAIYWALTGGSRRDSFSYRVYTQGTADRGKAWTCAPNGALRPVIADTWHKMEHYAKLNTTDPARDDSANADGIYKAWFDGVLCVDASDVKFRGTEALNVQPGAVFARIKWNPTYAGTPDDFDTISVVPLVIDTIFIQEGPEQPDTIFQAMTDLYVSGRNSLLSPIGDTASAVMYWFADMYDSTADLQADLAGDGVGDTSFGGIAAIQGGSYKEFIFLDTTTAYSILNSSARLDWVYTGSEPDCSDEGTEFTGCNARTIRIALHNNKTDLTVNPYDEVWLEFSFRNSPNKLDCSYNEAWGVANLPMTPGVNPSLVGYTNARAPCAHKMVELTPDQWQSTWNRWMFVPGGGSGGPAMPLILELFYGDSILYGYDFNGFQFPQTVDHGAAMALRVGTDISSYMYDANWHMVRAHLWPSSDLVTYDGGETVWYDGAMIAHTDSSGAPILVNTAFEDGGFRQLYLGSNKDHGGVFPHTESIYWGHAIIWTTAPSWYQE